MCLACAGSIRGCDLPQAVPTFHCVGLYWSPEDGAAENTCRVRYRQAGVQEWREALPLWFDGAAVPGLAGGAAPAVPGEHCQSHAGNTVRDRAIAGEDGPAGDDLRTDVERGLPHRTDRALRNGPTPVIVEQSGSPDGYVLYTPAQGRATATIDVAGQHPQCIEVRASHVILRGLTLKNAQQHGIRIFEVVTTS